jgi:hypothetical protein
MQRKSKLVVLLIDGIVGFVGFVVVLLLVSKPSEPVKVTLQSYTNGYAVISITNQTSISFEYFAKVERKFGDKWPNRLSEDSWGLGTMLEPHDGILSSGQHTNLTMAVKVHIPPYPWRISVIYSRRSLRVNSVHYRAAVWCDSHGLDYVSQKLFAAYKQIEVSTPEMAQRFGE